MSLALSLGRVGLFPVVTGRTQPRLQEASCVSCAQADHATGPPICVDAVGKRCAELGCGTGLVGICLSRLKACRSVILTDGNRDSLQNCCRNLDQNGIPYVGPDSMASHGPKVCHPSMRFCSRLRFVDSLVGFTWPSWQDP